MNLKRLLSWIGIVSAITSLIAFFDLYFLDSSLSSFFQYSVAMPLWIIVAFTALFLAAFLLIPNRKNANEGKTISADAESIHNYVMGKNLLNMSRNVDLFLYTAETLVIPWRHLLEEHSHPLTIRLLSRRPETDSRKQNAAEASLDTIFEILRQNHNLDIDVHFYNTNPMLRMQMYGGDKNSTCLLGFYRYADEHPMRWVGAENNSMVILDTKIQGEKEMIGAISTQFEYQWNATSPLRAVIFDLDGVLINSMEFHFRSWQRVLDQAGIKFRVDDLRSEIYQREGEKDEVTIQELYHKYLGKKTDKKSLEQLVALKRRYYLESTQNISPQEGVYKILNFLGDRGIPLAVVTGTEREAAKRIVEHWFPKYFKVLITGSDVLAGKPNPEPYNMAIKQLGIGKSNHCIVIENAPHGVRSARDADLIVFGLLVGSPLTPGDLNKAGASRVFSGFEELQQAIGMLRYSDTLKK